MNRLMRDLGMAGVDQSSFQPAFSSIVCHFDLKKQLCVRIYDIVLQLLVISAMKYLLLFSDFKSLGFAGAILVIELNVDGEFKLPGLMLLEQKGWSLVVGAGQWYLRMPCLEDPLIKEIIQLFATHFFEYSF